MDNSEDIDYKFADTIRIHYPALYKKDAPERSDRDIVKNSWKGLCQRMHITDVAFAKEWWNRLLDSYTNEKKQLKSDHGKSGSGAPAKREKFTLHDLMKDMLRTSQASRPTTTNYVSNAALNKKEDVGKEKDTQALHDQTQEDCYNSFTASGRRGRKQLEVEKVKKQIDSAVLDVQKAISMNAQGTISIDGNLNEDVGELIYQELQRMDATTADEKRLALLGLQSALKK